MSARKSRLPYRETIVEMRKEGKLLREIVEATGLAISTIHRVLHEMDPSMVRENENLIRDYIPPCPEYDATALRREEYRESVRRIERIRRMGEPMEAI